VCLCPRGVCPACIKLNWLYLIYHPLRVAGWVGGGRAEMVASCQQGMSPFLEIRRDARGRDVNVPQNQIDGCLHPRRAWPPARSTRRAQNQIKPTRYRSLCSLLVSGDAFSASVRMGGEFPVKTDYNQIPSTERKKKEKRKSLWHSRRY